MALIISQQDNTISLEGKLNTATVNNFQTHFGFIIKAFKNITLNIEKLTVIDDSAMQTLKEMYKNGVLNNAMFFIEGKRSEEIFEAFQYPQVA
ncbi:STAS domain-containing protein [Olleya sp. R77988]|uniref:STAS domain-containing protein n=1 Tax=Olleya sp. R77988 TaxID=3093875 RepID=UPI0037C97ED5